MKRIFEKAFVPPFNIGDHGSWCTDEKGEFCFQTVEYLTLSDKKQLEESINNKTIKRDNVSYERKSGMILVDDKALILIRGWGYLTGSGGLNLPDEEAAAIQDDLATYLVEQLKGQL